MLVETFKFLPLTFYRPKQVTWPTLTMRQGSILLLQSQSNRQKYLTLLQGSKYLEIYRNARAKVSESFLSFPTLCQDDCCSSRHHSPIPHRKEKEGAKINRKNSQLSLSLLRIFLAVSPMTSIDMGCITKLPLSTIQGFCQ